MYDGDKIPCYCSADTNSDSSYSDAIASVINKEEYNKWLIAHEKCIEWHWKCYAYLEEVNVCYRK